MTREEALLISAYTGVLLVEDFQEVREYCEKVVGFDIGDFGLLTPEVKGKIESALYPEIMKLKQKISNPLDEILRDQNSWEPHNDGGREWVKMLVELIKSEEKQYWKGRYDELKEGAKDDKPV